MNPDGTAGKRFEKRPVTDGGGEDMDYRQELKSKKKIVIKVWDFDDYVSGDGKY